jgi:hypothetical protein
MGVDKKVITKTKKTMKKSSPDFRKFIKQLEKSVNFRGEGDKMTWSCNAKPSMPKATRILNSMGYDVKSSKEYLNSQGAGCDCEILMNISK